MRLFRDHYSNFPCVFHLTGLDVCEKFFSKVGGMVGMERAYDFTDLLHDVGTLNRVTEEESNPQGFILINLIRSKKAFGIDCTKK